ncbi:hypothetical protein AB835_03510 [Candidatus Endobugula sertula]|uniref:Radical SAM protein n=1 Tax=Candidatus Endobugula sertula TaxID=62101 RepID=A0A1D2QSE9_9GAMM|nr:hypothetical protein AB835_03510 [Candidatus Endobugula sertula]
MSGGEALLRPKLVHRLAEMARRVGVKSSVLSGLFFANHSTIPKNIEKAIRSVDHFSVSTDIFHEAEVPRRNVFKTLETVLSYGSHVSIHIVGRDQDDPYLLEVTEEIQENFGESVPILVNSLSSFGRARDWLKVDGKKQRPLVQAMPCTMAAWPVMSYDGTIVACGNDDAIDHLPKHLYLGHAQKHSWQQISEKTRKSYILRAIRLFGPDYIAQTYSDEKNTCDGYCETCMALSSDATLEKHLQTIMQRNSTHTMEELVLSMHQQGGAESFIRSQGVAKYASLAILGAPT